MQENICFLLPMEICCYILVIFICCWPKRMKCKSFHIIWKKKQNFSTFTKDTKKNSGGVEGLPVIRKKIIKGEGGSEDLRWDNCCVGVWAEQPPPPGLYVCEGLGGYSTECTSEHLQIARHIVIEDIIITLVAVIVNRVITL